MNSNPNNGSDSAAAAAADDDDGTPSTFGGPGWRPRVKSLSAEIEEGEIWRRCGCSSETGRLKEVLLSMPGGEIEFTGPPGRYLMMEKPDLPKLRKQASALAELYESLGVTVHLWEPPSPPPPNFLFMRDLFWTTPEGIVLSRPASEQRAGEERFAAEALAGIGVPVIMSPRGNGTFEGADALWLDGETVLIGTGIRTNVEGARQIERLLVSMDVEMLEIPLPQGVQHLLGIVNFIDPVLAAVHGGKTTPRLTGLLRDRGIETIVHPPDDELENGRGMNFVSLGERRLVMPSGCPGISEIYEKRGIEVFEVDMTEYLKAAGGPGCVTGILLRE